MRNHAPKYGIADDDLLGALLAEEYAYLFRGKRRKFERFEKLHSNVVLMKIFASVLQYEFVTQSFFFSYNFDFT